MPSRATRWGRPISRVLRPRLLVAQHRRHHPRCRRVESSPEIEASLHRRRPLDRGFGQRQIDLVQGDGQATVGIDGEGQREFRRGAGLRLGQQRGVLAAHGDLAGAAGDAGIHALDAAIGADGRTASMPLA